MCVAMTTYPDTYADVVYLIKHDMPVTFTIVKATLHVSRFMAATVLFTPGSTLIQPLVAVFTSVMCPRLPPAQASMTTSGCTGTSPLSRRSQFSLPRASTTT